jgi:hypothetical protein
MLHGWWQMVGENVPTHVQGGLSHWQLHAILTNDYDDSQTYRKTQKHMKMHDYIHIILTSINIK